METRRYIGDFSKEIEIEINNHGVKLLRFKKIK